MKRLILITVLCLSLLTGCGFGKDSKTTPAPTKKPVPTDAPAKETASGTEDGMVDGNGSEDGVLDTDDPNAMNSPAVPDDMDILPDGDVHETDPSVTMSTQPEMIPGDETEPTTTPEAR